MIPGTKNVALYPVLFEEVEEAWVDGRVPLVLPQTLHSRHFSYLRPVTHEDVLGVAVKGKAYCTLVTVWPAKTLRHRSSDGKEPIRGLKNL